MATAGSITMLNPLDRPGEVFDLELLNPNPTSSKTKDGPVYRVSFEVPPDVWQWFMDGKTKGMLLAAKATVVADAEDDAPLHTEKGEHGQASKILYAAGVHRSALVREALGGDAAYLAWIREQPCCSTRTEHSTWIQAAHVRRVAAGAGTGTKPLYSVVPLCDACHRLQHTQGESAVGGKDYLDKQVQKHLDAWAWHALARALGCESMTHANPSTVVAWFDARDFRVPVAYRELATQ